MEIDRPNVNDRDNQNPQDRNPNERRSRWIFPSNKITVKPPTSIEIGDRTIPLEQYNRLMDQLLEIGRIVMEKGGLESPASPEDW